jgi:hypothetical protein
MARNTNDQRSVFDHRTLIENRRAPITYKNQSWCANKRTSERGGKGGRANNQQNMVYGNHKVRMVGAKKEAPAAADAGHMPFRKAGPEYALLKTIMEAKGNEYNQVTAQSVIAEEPWFSTFKPNSLKANITSLKKEFNTRGNVEGLRK